jgi:hypothetical protein
MTSTSSSPIRTQPRRSARGVRNLATRRRWRPPVLRGLVAAPPLPGVGARISTPPSIRQFRYQSFHQNSIWWRGWSTAGRTRSVRVCGTSGRTGRRRIDRQRRAIEHLVSVYSPAGALLASVGWYRAGAVARAQSEVPPPADERIARPDCDPVGGRRPGDAGGLVGGVRRGRRRRARSRAPTTPRRRRSRLCRIR